MVEDEDEDEDEYDDKTPPWASPPVPSTSHFACIKPRSTPSSSHIQHPFYLTSVDSVRVFGLFRTGGDGGGVVSWYCPVGVDIDIDVHVDIGAGVVVSPGSGDGDGIA